MSVNVFSGYKTKVLPKHNGIKNSKTLASKAILAIERHTSFVVNGVS